MKIKNKRETNIHSYYARPLLQETQFLRRVGQKMRKTYGYSKFKGTADKEVMKVIVPITLLVF